MTEVIKRKAGVVWNGDLKTGKGMISTESQSLYEAAYTRKTRFDGDDNTGTTPEELIAAAHAASFNMTLVSTLKKNGFDPKQTDTTATCSLDPHNGGYAITGMELHVRADVPNLDKAKFQKMVMEAEDSCPVSNLLRKGLKIEIDATLI